MHTSVCDSVFDQIKIHFVHKLQLIQRQIYTQTHAHSLYLSLKTVKRLRKYFITLEIRRDVNGVDVSCSLATRMLSNQERKIFGVSLLFFCATECNESGFYHFRMME